MGIGTTFDTCAEKGAFSSIEPVFENSWPNLIPLESWSIYKSAIHAARNAGVPFLVGGAFGLATYTGRWRDTKDLDFFVMPRDRCKMIEALTNAGFIDYYNTVPYDRGWLYRGMKDDVIVDIIWSMANRRAEVDDVCFLRARPFYLRDELVQIFPPEELLWWKIYVIQRDRCDWPDIINLIYANGPQIDWDHLVKRLSHDVLLLSGILVLFSWLCPNRAAELPSHLWKKLKLSNIPSLCTISPEDERIRLLDSRRWFAAFQSDAKPLEI